MPKINAFKPMLYTADVYNYKVITGQKTQYSFLRSTKLDLTQGVFGKVNVFFPNDCDDIMQNAQLMHLKDKNGNEVYPGGVWSLTGILPILTNFGTREGFRSTAELTFETTVG